MTNTLTTEAPPFNGLGPAVRRAVERRSFATLATTSPAGRPHVAGVLYSLVDGALYVSTLRSSRKARNISAHRQVAVCIPIRRLPVGPPSSVQLQAVAAVLAVDDPFVIRLAAAGRLGAITGHGELDLPDGCVLRITLLGRVLTYGLGMPLRRLIRDPLNAAGVADVDWT